MDKQAVFDQALDRLVDNFITPLESLDDSAVAIEFLCQGLQKVAEGGFNSQELLGCLGKLTITIKAHFETEKNPERKQYWTQTLMAILLAATVAKLLIDSFKKEAFDKVLTYYA